MTHNPDLKFVPFTGSHNESRGFGGYKPRGLWYSPDNDWVDWCSSEAEGWIKPYFYEVEITPRVLRIENPSQFDAFMAEFGVAYKDTGLNFIDWDKVARRWAGIEIIPYQHERRFLDRCSWYYGWDVASGCIWSAEGLASLKRFWTVEKMPTIEGVNHIAQTA